VSYYQLRLQKLVLPHLQSGIVNNISGHALDVELVQLGDGSREVGDGELIWEALVPPAERECHLPAAAMREAAQGKQGDLGRKTIDNSRVRWQSPWGCP